MMQELIRHEAGHPAGTGTPADPGRSGQSLAPVGNRPEAAGTTGTAGTAETAETAETAGIDTLRSGGDSSGANQSGVHTNRLQKAGSAAQGHENDSLGVAMPDSLRFGTDSLGIAGPDSLRFRQDSLGFHTIGPLMGSRYGTAETADSTAIYWRDTTAAALFGSESVTLQPESLERPIGESFTDNAVFQGFVLLLAATYATLLYRNLGDVRTLLNRISRDSASGERLAEEPGASGFSRFLTITAAIGMLFMGVIVVKYGDTLMPPELGQALSHAAVLALSLLATLAWALIVLFQASVIRIAGAITLSQPFIAQLALLRRSYFALAVIITSPTLLLFALCPRGTGGAWFIIGAVELIITAVLYLRESLNLFISKKISILHWILYLCTVEVFPISLLWLLATR